MASTDYHMVTLPAKNGENPRKVPVRDHFLREGRTFSITGHVKASAVSFDGTGNVVLDASLDGELLAITDEEIAEIIPSPVP